MGLRNRKEGLSLGLPFRETGGEKLLQYIWQFQYFNNSQLQTTAGEPLQIIFPGKLNGNQGPDFTEAQVKIEETTLVGSIEIHLKASQWKEHGHSEDSNYKNVVLHVVFENDCPASTVPVLELQSRISGLLLERYSLLMNSPAFIPCAPSVAQVKEITWTSWKERLLAERLTRKSTVVFNFLEESKRHWEEAFWWMLARNFGTKVNSEAFEWMARSIPSTILARHKSQIHQVEALLFGQAGLLDEDFKEDYPRLLQREYRFLKNKYGLQGSSAPVHFLRMRPGNFPTVRLSQLAALMHNSAHLFSRILDTENLGQVRKLFEVTANDYWHYHYRFDEPSGFKKKTLGKNMTDNLVINTMVPVVFAYGIYHKEEKYKNRAIRWLEESPAEVNSITRGFTSLQLAHRSAFDSQAFIELKTKYCDARHCLRCAVGNAILKIPG